MPVVVVVGGSVVLVVVVGAWQPVAAQPEAVCVDFDAIVTALPWHTTHLASAGVLPTTAWHTVQAELACVGYSGAVHTAGGVRAGRTYPHVREGFWWHKERKFADRKVVATNRWLVEWDMDYLLEVRR